MRKYRLQFKDGWYHVQYKDWFFWQYLHQWDWYHHRPFTSLVMRRTKEECLAIIAKRVEYDCLKKQEKQQQPKPTYHKVTVSVDEYCQVFASMP